MTVEAANVSDKAMSIAARETDVRICDLLCHGANAPVAANVPQKGPFPIQRGPPGLREGQKGPFMPNVNDLLIIAIPLQE